jgi:hypothetical protein
MRLQLFQDLLDLNLAFDHVLLGLERMEKVKLFRSQELRYARAEVECARVEANREFFENFDGIVESDARWAYRYRRDYDRELKDPFDLYLEVKEREEVRRKKGLPPRVVLLPGWDKDDERRYDEEQVRKRKRAANKHRKLVKKIVLHSPKPTNQAPTGVGPTSEGKAGS